MLKKLLVTLGAAALLAAPAAAQRVQTLPAASTLTGSEKIVATQGTGCATSTAPCTAVAITPSQLGTFVGNAFQPLDSDLTSIASLSTQSFGRSLLTQADAGSTRSTLGLGTIATQAASAVAITGGTITGITDLAIVDGGTGASTAAAARTNLGLATVAATGLDTDLSGAAWTAYTPTVACSSGALTTSTPIGRYKRIGRTVFVQLRIAITTLGSCASAIYATVPFAAAATGSGSTNDGWILAGREDQATGNMLQAKVQQNTNMAYIFTYNNGFPAANSTVLLLSGSYEGA
jgi:hypothetical protein